MSIFNSINTSNLQSNILDFSCDISDGFINYQERGRNHYTYLFNTPEFDALMQTILEQRNGRQCQYIKIRKDILDIDKSEGLALDMIGKFVGQPRTLINFIVDPYFGFLGARNAQAFNIGKWYTLNAAQKGTLKTLSDEQYRRVIKSRIIKNDSRNTRKDLVDVLMLLGGSDTKLILSYPRHGVIQVDISSESDPDGLVSYFLSKYMEDKSIIPRPLGYRIASVYEEINYLTSKPYPIISEPELFSAFTDISEIQRRDIEIKYESEGEETNSFSSIETMSRKDINIMYNHGDIENCSSQSSVVSMVKKDVYNVLPTSTVEQAQVSSSVAQMGKKVVLISHNLFDIEKTDSSSSITNFTTSKVIKLEPYNIVYTIM